MKFKSGAFVLLVSGVLCKFLGAFFRLPLTNMLGIEGIGVFQLVMSLYSFALVLTSGGVCASLSKLISSARANERTEKISRYLRTALVSSVGVGLAIGLIFLIFGRYIAFLQQISSSISYALFVLMLPLGAGIATLKGFFQGYQNMLPTAISQVIEQTFKFVFGLIFAYYFSKIGIAEGVFGAFLGITISEVVALLYLLIYYQIKGRGRKEVYSKEYARILRKEFNSALLPLTLSASILPLVSAFEGLVIISRLTLGGLEASVATKLYGLQTGVVGALLHFPLIISSAVTTALLPNISYHISRGDGGKRRVESGLKSLLYLILPTTFGIVAISKPIFSCLYSGMTSSMQEVAFSLAFYGAFTTIFMAIMQFLIMLLQANGEFNYILLITTIGGALKAGLSFLLASVPSINIYALVLSGVVLSATICLLGLIRLKKIVTFSLPFLDVLSLLFGTFLMYVGVYTFVESSYFSPIVNIILGVLIGVLVYVVLTIGYLIKIFPKIRVFKKARK